jgi:hypothetical protein
MHRLISLLGLVVAVLLAAGCDNKPKGPIDVPVTGQVKLDEKPMADGDIVFTVQGYPPSVMTVKDGAFSGTAKEGKNKVAVHAYKVGPPLSTDPDKKPTKTNYVAGKYNDQSTLSAEVKAGTGNDFKFDVHSK